MSLTKNEQISKTISETRKRHSNMCAKTYTAKIQKNKLKSAQIEALYLIFLEQKWFYNYVLNFIEDNNILDFDTKQKTITHKDKDGNDVEVTLKHLSAQSRQSTITRMLANMKTLKTLKVNDVQKPGRLRFKSEVNIVDFKQFGVGHKIINEHKIKLAGIPKYLQVNGLDQINGEITNARLVKKGDDFYVQYCVFEEKKQIERQNSIGIDFGCQTTLTFSDGKKIDVKVKETERLRRLQRKLARQKRGSHNYIKTKNLIIKEHQRIVNRKNDKANKIVHGLESFETVVIQDEQLKSWHKTHSKAVQYSVLGRVKAKLVKMDNVVILNRFVPTTKFCSKCGQIHDEMTQQDRQFKCSCGIFEDRDVHAAKNMLFFWQQNVGVERADVKRVEIEALAERINSANFCQRSTEATVPLGRG